MRKFTLITLFVLIGIFSTKGQMQIIPLMVDSAISVSDIDIISQDTIIFSSRSKIYRTTNGGMSWDSSETNLPNVQKLDFIDFDHGVVVHPIGMKRTYNGGLTWDSIGFVPAYSYGDCHMIDTTHFIVTTDSGYIRHIYSNYYINDTLVDPLAIGYPVVIFNFDFLDANEGFGGGVVNGFSAVIHTVDNGLTWDVRANSGFLYLYMHEISFFNPLIGAAIEFGPGSFEKIVVTDDGGYTWQKSAYFDLTKVTSIDFNENGKGLAIT
ncbi:MAG TPA: hypothetical protein PK736_09450, partial [Bacteroidia bacterium]|nr:hypothetical protein [Bacteroidia bacterium]